MLRRSQDRLSDEPAGAKREGHDRGEHDRGEREDADALAYVTHGTDRGRTAARRCEKSQRAGDEDGPVGPRERPAAARAAGRILDRLDLGEERRARSASSAAASARVVARRRWRRASAERGRALRASRPRPCPRGSRRPRRQSPRAGAARRSYSTPAGLCAPSQISSGASAHLLEPARDASVGGGRVDGAAEDASDGGDARARHSSRPRRRRARRRRLRPPPPTRAPRATSVAPGVTTASFSAAIASRVSPRCSVCSSATFVSTTTGAARTFVASSRPPRPGLDHGDVDPGGRELRERRGRQHLELRRADAPPPPAGRARARLSRSASRPSTRIRSDQPVTCGEV